MATELEERLLRALEKAEKQNESLAVVPAQPPPTVTVNSNPSGDGGLGTRVALLERRVDALEDQAEKTENKSYHDLQDELKRYKDSSSHWTRYVVTAVVTLFSGGLLLWIGRLLGKQ